MRRLLDVLREDLGLTGTKEGCGEGECGACSVILDGRSSTAASCPSARSRAPTSARSRGWPAPAEPRALSPLQQAFLESGGAQCGICTPGMLMAAQAYLDAGGDAEEDAHPRGHRRQPLPLHRLHEDHRRHRAGRWRLGIDLDASRMTRPDQSAERCVEPPVVSPARLAEAYALMARRRPSAARRRHRPHGPARRRTSSSRPQRSLDLWRLDELRGIGYDGYDGRHRRPDHVHGAPSQPGHPGTPAGARGGRRHDRRGADPEPGHDRRQHLQRLAGGRHAAGPAGRGRPFDLGSAAGERSVPARRVLDRLPEDGAAPDELLLRVRFPVERVPAHALPQGGHAPRPGHLQGRHGAQLPGGRRRLAGRAGGPRLGRCHADPRAARPRRSWRARAPRETRGRPRRGVLAEELAAHRRRALDGRLPARGERPRPASAARARRAAGDDPGAGG